MSFGFGMSLHLIILDGVPWHPKQCQKGRGSPSSLVLVVSAVEKCEQLLSIRKTEEKLAKCHSKYFSVFSKTVPQAIVYYTIPRSRKNPACRRLFSFNISLELFGLQPIGLIPKKAYTIPCDTAFSQLILDLLRLSHRNRAL